MQYLNCHPGDQPTPAHVMAFTQRAWRLNPHNANECNLILSCCLTPKKERQIIGVFKFSRENNRKKGQTEKDYFTKSPWDNPDENRYIFLAEPASESEWNKYVGLMLPPPQSVRRG